MNLVWKQGKNNDLQNRAGFRRVSKLELGGEATENGAVEGFPSPIFYRAGTAGVAELSDVSGTW